MSSLQTKVEFSRRSARIPHSTGIPDQELLRDHKMFPFAARFYDSEEMCAQKILALSSLSRHAARDLFDLDHLWTMSPLKPEAIKKLVEPQDVEKAVGKAESFTHKDFKEQVLPYLTESLCALHGNAHAFDQLKKRVEDSLLEIWS